MQQGVPRTVVALAEHIRAMGWRARAYGEAADILHIPLAIDALAKQVLAKNPKHPAHHYLIHLWDHERPAQALHAASM